MKASFSSITPTIGKLIKDLRKPSKTVLNIIIKRITLEKYSNILENHLTALAYASNALMYL